MRQDGLAKHLSSLSKIRSDTCLRLDQVNLGLEKPKPKRLQESMQSLNSIALLRLSLQRPNLSSPLRISLKSPKTNQGRECSSATLDRLDHKILLSTKCGLA